MFLKRLDIQGFKTFAARTVFDFGPGISAIVGPNGSGKSNIADAVRWALGEQNPRAVRCKHGEDVIFAGSSKRAPVGMAEVSLTFDNTSGWLPIDYTEVAITRRAYRSGENEYLLNGARVRLRDVADLLRRASLEAGGHVVVGQGVVDAVLSQRAEERRALVENLAGLRHYYVRRDEAEGRLRAVEANLGSIRAVVAETEPLLATLSEQAEVARAYAVVREELTGLLGQAHAHQRRALLVRCEEAAARAVAAQGALRDLTAALGEARAARAVLARDEQEAVAAQGALEAELRRAGAAREEAERDLAVARARAESQRRRAADLEGDLARLAERIAAAREEVQRAGATQAAAGARLTAQEEALRAHAAAEAAHEEGLRTTGQSLRTVESATGAARARADAAGRELASAQAAAQRARDEARVLAGELARDEERLAAAERALQAARPAAEAAREASREAAAEVQRLEADAAAARGTHGTVAQRRDEARQTLAAAEKRGEMLERWLADMARAHPLLARRAEESDVLGSLAETLRIPAAWQAAVAAALGPVLQAAVLREQEALSAAAITAAAAGWPRVAVVARDLQGPRALPEEDGEVLRACLEATGMAVAGPAEAIVGWAADLLGEGAADPLPGRLLQGTLVVRDVQTALRCRGHLRPGMQLVTLGGELLWASGVLFCGRDGGLTQLVEFHDELARLPAVVEALRGTLADAEATLAERQAALRAAEGGLAEARARAARAADGARAAAAEVSLQDRLHEAAVRERERAARQLASCEARAAELTGALAALQQNSATAAEERTRAEAATASARREHGARLAERDALRGRRQSLNSAVALARQEAATAEAARARAAGTLAEAERDLAAKEAQRSRLAGEAAALAEAEARAAERRERVLAQVAALSESLEPARDRVATVRTERAAHESALARQEGEHSGLATAARAAEEAQQRAARDLETLAETVEADLGLALDELPEPEGAPPASGRLRALRGRLAEFGAVNQLAVADYEATAARLAFLQEQVRDLEEGLVLLREVIDEANASVRAQFASTVAQLEEHFVVYFRQLFAGGSCALQALYDAAGMPSGLEVRAQPPGKRAQDLALLSGGERALVALALLFAMLAVRPVPFCLLDEVEAALDESNTGRFAEILRSQSGRTQFVLITHNRGTMVQADSLYGVTMGEAGTSQVASLALRDADADRYAARA